VFALPERWLDKATRRANPLALQAAQLRHPFQGPLQRIRGHVMSCGQTPCPDFVAGRDTARCFAGSVQPQVDAALCKGGFFAGVFSVLLMQVVKAIGTEETLKLLATSYHAVLHGQLQRTGSKPH